MKKYTQAASRQPAQPSNRQVFFSPVHSARGAKQDGADFFQAQSNIALPKNKYEREADATADKVVSQTRFSPMIRLRTGRGIYRQTIPVNNSPISTPVPSELSSSVKNKAGRGKKMAANTEREMEAAFAADFSGVRIHTDQEAARMNTALDAQAFTYGQDIFFSNGKYAPQSREGKHLLAHELTHVVQQQRDTIQRKPAGKKKAANGEQAQRQAIYADFVRGIKLHPVFSKRIPKAMQAFSLSQLKKMQQVGLRFWMQGRKILLGKSKEPYLVRAIGRANYTFNLRVVGLLNTSQASSIVHEFAHAWDHIQTLKRWQRVRLDNLSKRRLKRFLSFNVKMKSDKRGRRGLKRAFKKYKKRMLGGKRRLARVDLQECTFENSGVRVGYSLSTVSEFYAEGYAVFHGESDLAKARLLKYAPELYQYLEKEAKRYKMKRPNKAALKKIKLHCILK